MEIETTKTRPGYGVTLPPECLARLDPWLEAQAALDASLIGISNMEAARQSPDALRAALNGAGWLLLSDSEREALRD